MNKVLAINPLGPIVHGLYFWRDNVFSIRCILVTLRAEPSSFFLSEKEKEEALPYSCWSSQSCFSHQPGDELACCTKCMAVRFGYKTVFKLLATSLRASSPGGKRKESFQLCPSGIWIPPPIPLWLPVDWAVKFLPISMKQKRAWM